MVEQQTIATVLGVFLGSACSEWHPAANGSRTPNMSAVISNEPLIALYRTQHLWVSFLSVRFSKNTVTDLVIRSSLHIHF